MMLYMLNLRCSCGRFSGQAVPRSSRSVKAG